jgi:hypothetical protein
MRRTRRCPPQAQIPQRQAPQAPQPHGHGQPHLVRQHTIASPQEHLVCQQQQQQRSSSAHSQPPAADDHTPEPAAACDVFAHAGSTSTAALALTSSTALGAPAAALTPCAVFKFIPLPPLPSQSPASLASSSPHAHPRPAASQSPTYHPPHSRLQHSSHSSYPQPSAQSHGHQSHPPPPHQPQHQPAPSRRQSHPSLRLRLSRRPSCSTSPSLIHNNIKLNATDTTPRPTPTSMRENSRPKSTQLRTSRTS